MWLSQRITQPEAVEEAGTLGTVSIGGVHGAVITDAEKRSARVIAPGGYVWVPRVDESVLIVRGNELYLAGRLLLGEGIEPGEVKIFSDGAAIHIRNDGKIAVEGELLVNGRKVLTE